MSNTIPTSGLAAMPDLQEQTMQGWRANRDAQVTSAIAAGFQAAGNQYRPEQKAMSAFQAIHDIQLALQQASSTALLSELSSRGGHPGALADAALLCIKKSQDYNPGQSDPHKVDRTSYFPFGATSYAQMLHTKSQRFNSLVQKQQAAIQPNFEGLRDTALDIINYAGFYLADPRTPK